jgi:hypothetical protein
METVEKLLREKTRFVHEEDISKYMVDRLNIVLFDFLKLYIEVFGEESLKELRIEIRTMNKEGFKKEFEVKTDLFCDNGVFSVKKVGWNLYQLASKSLSVIKSKLF